jgi:hypothetical protein
MCEHDTPRQVVVPLVLPDRSLQRQEHEQREREPPEARWLWLAAPEHQ